MARAADHANSYDRRLQESSDKAALIGTKINKINKIQET